MTRSRWLVAAALAALISFFVAHYLASMKEAESKAAAQTQIDQLQRQLRRVCDHVKGQNALAQHWIDHDSRRVEIGMTVVTVLKGVLRECEGVP